jgi:hypothetical protein
VTRTLQERAVLGYSLALSAGATAASWALVSPRFAGSLALGAALEAMNFRTLFRYWRSALLGGERLGLAAFGSFGARFVVLGGLVWAALAFGAHPVGLLLGLSLVVPAVLVAAWRARPAPSADAPALDPEDPSWNAWNPWFARERDRDPDGDEDES